MARGRRRQRSSSRRGDRSGGTAFRDENHASGTANALPHLWSRAAVVRIYRATNNPHGRFRSRFRLRVGLYISPPTSRGTPPTSDTLFGSSMPDSADKAGTTEGGKALIVENLRVTEDMVKKGTAGTSSLNTIKPFAMSSPPRTRVTPRSALTIPAQSGATGRGFSPM